MPSAPHGAEVNLVPKQRHKADFPGRNEDSSSSSFDGDLNQKRPAPVPGLYSQGGRGGSIRVCSWSWQPEPCLFCCVPEVHMGD